MNKMLKSNKGFSLVELLIALLIMGVIAAIAIGLFSGVLNSSKSSADREAGTTIEKALMTYAAASNDYGLEMLGVTVTPTGSIPSATAVSVSAGVPAQIINALRGTITITKNATNATNFDAAFSAAGTNPTVSDKDTVNDSIYTGTYGPFLNANKSIAPQQPGMLGWSVTYHVNTSTYEIGAAATSAALIVADIK